MLDQSVRAKGIGGSEIAAVLGQDPNRDAFSVWMEKKGLVQRPEPTPLMELGKLMEQAIAQYYSRVTGRPIAWVDETRVHPERPWHVYTVDALCTEEPRGVDAKLVLGGYYEWGEDPDAVPARVDLQARWYMAALDYPVWDIMAVVGATPRIYTIQRDLEFEDAILERVAEFYWRNIVGDEPPEPGASTATTEYIKQRYKDHSALVRPATDTEAALLDDFAIARKEFDEAEEAKKKLQNQLCNAIANDAGITTEDLTLTWKRTKDGLATDWEGLANKMLERYDAEDRAQIIENHTAPKPGYRRIHFTDRRRD